MNTEQAWRTWWDAEGKHMERLPHHDAVDHMASVTRIAWLNGAFGAADEIERLREALRIEQEESAACAIDRKETQRERDEARREVCEWVAMMTKRKPSTAAKDRGWDCFKEMNQ